MKQWNNNQVFKSCFRQPSVQQHVDMTGLIDVMAAIRKDKDNFKLKWKDPEIKAVFILKQNGWQHLSRSQYITAATTQWH